MERTKKPVIEKSRHTGFCFGVKRAVEKVEEIARERGSVQTLGAIAHNQQVIDSLKEIGVVVAHDIDDISGDVVVTSSHGIRPDQEKKIRARGINPIQTTCPYVRRAQLAAEQLAERGFFVIVFGDAAHPEVRGILGWAGDNGLATTDEQAVAELEPLPKKIGVLSQTTQVPAFFKEFVKKIIDLGLEKNSDIHIVDTICHDLRDRQTAAADLARRSDLMFVVGGRSSANTNRLVEICALETETRHIETADEINPAWLVGKQHIGVTSGASTADRTVDEVIRRLTELTIAG